MSAIKRSSLDDNNLTVPSLLTTRSHPSPKLSRHQLTLSRDARNEGIPQVIVMSAPSTLSPNTQLCPFAKQANNTMELRLPANDSRNTVQHPSTLSLLTPPTPAKIGSSSLAPNKTKTSKRVHLGPGCGMLDWIRLCRNTPDMAGTGGVPKSVTEEELARHCTEDDAWTCYQGKVYNITHYFKFHPGGKCELLRAAGKDCTILYNDVHKWVNIESMLKKCYIGTMAVSPRRDSLTTSRTRSDSLTVPKPIIVLNGINRYAVAKRESESSDDASVHSPQSPVNPPFHVSEETDSAAAIIVVPPSPIRKNSDAQRPSVPRWDWYQTEKNIFIHVFTHNKTIRDTDIVLDIRGQRLEATVLLDNWFYQLEMALRHPVTKSQVNIHSSKIEIQLTKGNGNIQWDSIGVTLPGNDQMIAVSNKERSYRECTVSSIEDITHDTKLYTLTLPSTTHMSVPVGHHITIKAGNKGHEVERSYTPVQPLNSTSSLPSSPIQLMIKLYPDGVMSQHLAKLKEGDVLNVSNPEGTFDVNRLQSVTEAVLIAAGSGFTPMVRVVQQLLSLSTSEKRKTQLIFANKTEKDIIWKNELDTLHKSHDNFTTTHILSAADKSWSGLRGRVSADLLRTHLPNSSHDNLLVCVCGPQPFTTAVSAALLDMNIHENSLHVFD